MKIKKTLNLDGCPCVKDVAIAYFPQYHDPRTAVAAFRKKIATTPQLWKELLDAEYNPNEKHLTAAQLIIIVEHWKMPDELAKFREKWQ
ncbi:DUF4248 domain-containing protein [Oscillospiraceae bacterium N12]|jgi:hypothetical protein|uniref:DUF4248 domain-containing protein n=1 Tax=Jilunia laotingensis TaxID=2763675 RepID=A0A926F922_9BACT|nr:DUF4248 domain-containing protein [Jilunia laotingensis]MBC8594292.1 DUF4248 domain-containing protein [Jilunia laotingensis]